jgi:hypothetical protein
LKSFKELAVGPVTCQTDRFFASYLKRLAGSLKLLKKTRFFDILRTVDQRFIIPDPYPPISSFFEKERTLIIAQDCEKSYTYLYIPIIVGTYQ